MCYIPVTSWRYTITRFSKNFEHHRKPTLMASTKPSSRLRKGARLPAGPCSWDGRIRWIQIPCCIGDVQRASSDSIAGSTACDCLHHEWIAIYPTIMPLAVGLDIRQLGLRRLAVLRPSYLVQRMCVDHFFQHLSLHSSIAIMPLRLAGLLSLTLAAVMVVHRSC